MNSLSFNNTIREAQFAGQFYTDNNIKLEEQLNGFFANAELENKKKYRQRLRAIISPHAGYVFSGQVAASAFHQIPEKTKYQRIFILASSHRFAFNGAAVYCSGNYKTPLGEVTVDSNFCKDLTRNSSVFVNNPEAHLYEHSIEVQLPFLQHRLNNITIVPIILGTQNADSCRQIAQELKPWFTSENLFVISTDFSHYPDYENANKVDEITANSICSNQPEQLLSVLQENKQLKINNLDTSLCGWTSVLTLLYLTENSELKIKKLKYLNSGDSKKYHDKKRVVGYWAMAVYENGSSFWVSEEEKKEILDKARTSIKTFLETGKRGKLIDVQLNGILNKNTGVFVSVYIDNKLRGCIGGFAQEKTLNQMVQRMAVSAACDARFESVQHDEFDKMELEISVLSPLKKIESIDEIELGKHGIYIRDEINTGTFLPQVATKTGWDLHEFLGHCSRDKAGIGWEGWKKAEIFTYEAVIFRG